ncbi:MAG TPA: hypothetical protein VOA41_12200 [Candidatus Dormibacteraeota bacterium]|nr:hypothetical protein [Candidatus Dormibacteraeota bacterium]
MHFTKIGAANDPLHGDVLNSRAVAEVFRRYGTYLLPHALPEGCPQHPSYGQGHGTVAGACVTILKAFFDDSIRLSKMTDIVQSSDDGLALVPYNGLDRDRLTVGGELHKIAANIGIGRNHAAVHWRSDYANSLTLGEALAISVLRDQRDTYNEAFQGFTFRRFDGTTSPFSAATPGSSAISGRAHQHAGLFRRTHLLFLSQSTGFYLSYFIRVL